MDGWRRGRSHDEADQSLSVSSSSISTFFSRDSTLRVKRLWSPTVTLLECGNARIPAPNTAKLTQDNSRSSKMLGSGIPFRLFYNDLELFFLPHSVRCQPERGLVPSLLGRVASVSAACLSRVRATGFDGGSISPGIALPISDLPRPFQVS